MFLILGKAKPYYTVDQYMKRFKVSRSTVVRRIRAKLIKVVYFEGKTLIKYEEYNSSGLKVQGKKDHMRKAILQNVWYGSGSFKAPGRPRTSSKAKSRSKQDYKLGNDYLGGHQ